MLIIQALGVVLLVASVSMKAAVPAIPENTLDCHRREFTFKASQTDENGLQCWGVVTAMSCWGRCDTGEIGDWRFPFKRPFHPVCMHESREIRTTLLRNCDPDADLRIAEYEYYEAVSCACFVCDSSSTSCQGMPTIEESQRKGFNAIGTKRGQRQPVTRTE
ncbi:thyrostimulin beta-5 subunit [Caerostris darwini]|uniref:Thyrostimulin beta-5 subunit n=1 Tax=Caerostris darwini TaxID=1538125 RepID=A0AAV4SRX2_9ARAC|nr:thyrostimulin beta-5 subunit [Caerostris darwini]